jgi:hypothetical protein
VFLFFFLMNIFVVKNEEPNYGIHDLFPVLYFRVTTETYFAAACCCDVQSLPRFTLAGCHGSSCNRGGGGRRCCSSCSGGRWSDGSRRCWALLYNDYNPVIVATAKEATAVSVTPKPRPKTIIFSPVRTGQHRVGEDYENEEYLQNREQNVHL